MKDPSATKQKPLIVEMENAKTRFVVAVNESISCGLPCYIIADMLEIVLAQVRNNGKDELAAARASMELKEEKKNGTSNS